MPKTDPELKKQLMEQGQWANFVKYRQDLKISGVSGIEAQQQTLNKFFDNPPEAAKYRRTRAKPNTKAKKSVNLKPPDMAENGNVDGEGPASNPPNSPSPGSSPSTYLSKSRGTVNEQPVEKTAKSYTGDLPCLPPVHAEDFEGKQASEVEVIRWVASNMEVVNPKPVDCPSAAAWGLLAQCRSSIISRGEFWKQTYPKLLPSRTQMEMECDAVPDESKAKAIIDDLLRFSKEAEKKAAKEEKEEIIGLSEATDLPEDKEDENGDEESKWKPGEF